MVWGRALKHIIIITFPIFRRFSTPPRPLLSILHYRILFVAMLYCNVVLQCTHIMISLLRYTYQYHYHWVVSKRDVDLQNFPECGNSRKHHWSLNTFKFTFGGITPNRYPYTNISNGHLQDITNHHTYACTPLFDHWYYLESDAHVAINPTIFEFFSRRACSTSEPCRKAPNLKARAKREQKKWARLPRRHWLAEWEYVRNVISILAIT